MVSLSSLWSAPLPDYDLPALGSPIAAYILSALVGIALVALLVWLFTTLAVNGKKSPERVK